MRALAIVLSALLSALIFSPASAEEFEYKEYTVQKGDTLWDITGGELKDSFQWPLVWKENPKVANPDRIYPGQIILIPVGRKAQAEAELPEEAPAEAIVPKAEAPEPVIAKPAPPKPKEIKPIKSDFIVSRGSLLYAGYITNAVPRMGEVVGSPTGRKYFAHMDEVYLKTEAEARSGEKFYVIRKGPKVYHPVDKKLFMGWIVEIIGSIEVVRVDADGVLARVIEAFTEIAVGDPLDKHYDIELPYVLGAARNPDMRGHVVATKYMKVLSGQTDIIYIDKGSADGLSAGDVLMTVVPGTKERRSALIQIIATKERTSTALVLKGTSEVNKGDEFGGVR